MTAPAPRPQGMERSHFDALYQRADDPWRLRASWYEERKRALLLASLPAARYQNAYEPACAAGDLTALLAPRCERLLASDGSERAVEQTLQRTEQAGNVSVVQAWLPDEWPEGAFDLVVLSEFLYYLAPSALDQLLDRVLTTKTPGATIVACHWRAPIEGCSLAGDALHQHVHAHLQMPRVAHYLDDDLVLDVWQTGAQSPAQRENRR